MDDTNRLAHYISQLKNLPNLKRINQKGKRRQKPGSVVERSKAPVSKKLLTWEFWYTKVCVGSNPFPVRKGFERDEAEPWADKFSHTGTSTPDDSPKQKKSQRHPWLIPEQFQSAQKGGYPAETLETRMQPNWKSTYHTEKLEVSQAGWPSRLGRQTQGIPQSRILVHECVRGF